jgi:hypothetical protein
VVVVFQELGHLSVLFSIGTLKAVGATWEVRMTAHASRRNIKLVHSGCLLGSVPCLLLLLLLALHHVAVDQRSDLLRELGDLPEQLVDLSVHVFHVLAPPKELAIEVLKARI